MNYKVVVAIRNEKLRVMVRHDRDAAKALVLELIDEVQGAYVIGPTSIDQQHDTITVPLFKNNVHVGDITGAPVVGINRPLTGKYKELKLVMSKADAAFIAKDVIAITNEVLDGKYTGDTFFAPGLTVHDVISVNGFFTSPEVMEQIASVYIGRLFREAAKRCKINLDDSLEVMKCIPIMDLSTKLEKSAAKIAVAALTKKHGHPINVDQQGINRLMEVVTEAVMNKMAK